MKLLVIGYGRHGKDTVSEILNETYDLTFESSSKFCSQLFIYDSLKEKYGYTTEDECYEDRHNHRQEWYDAICAYNESDPSRLGKEMLNKYDVYCGLRNKREFQSLKNIQAYDYAIWVDRSDHLPSESKESNTLEQWMADYTIDNNGSLQDLRNNVMDLMDTLTGVYLN